VNPAVTAMLGYEDAAMHNKPLRDYCKDPSTAEDLLTSGPFPSKKVTLVGKRGGIDILLSASALPEELGGWIFIGKDLSLHKRVEELEFLGRMYYEVATQTKTPLSVAFSLLKSLKKDVSEPGEADLLEKALKQLNKVELTLDRLAIAERGTTALPYNEFLMDINELLEEVFKELPQSEVDKINLTPSPVPDILLRGDLVQLEFCLATIFSYLLRFAAEDKQISCLVNSDSHNLILEISGSYSPQERVFTRAAWDIALGQPILEQIFKKHQGQLIPETRKESLIFTITLPKAQEM
jgi:K+-sensing histidine kinase KdpD